MKIITWLKGITEEALISVKGESLKSASLAEIAVCKERVAEANLKLSSSKPEGTVKEILNKLYELESDVEDAELDLAFKQKIHDKYFSK